MLLSKVVALSTLSTEEATFIAPETIGEFDEGGLRKRFGSLTRKNIGALTTPFVHGSRVLLG